MTRPPLPAAYDPWARLTLARERVRRLTHSRFRIGQRVGTRAVGVYGLAHRAVETARRELDRAIAAVCE